MWLARLTGKLLKLGAAAYVLVTLVMLAWTFVWPAPDTDEFKPVDAVVCLGGGMSADGTLDASVLKRIERCVQLFEADRAPIVVFSGGSAIPGGPDAGTQMSQYATTLGLPETAAVVESRAQSTLQNALFSLSLIPDASRVILVTEAFHLPRSWASFKWAAWEKDHKDLVVFLAMSENVRRDPTSGRIGWRILARESLAIWFNAFRAVAYSITPNPDVSWLH